ncbi:hypothetical protein M9H77_26580 [Catharanthus roseus]|uniref:Uncharacterized protein n=1 Tax=Catharanthus roseus TaxID=4058 RepID=A0ACC0ABH1_CATRO|nr:hypothetical protein M9H77_26580 [Catharanthus roseus]
MDDCTLLDLGFSGPCFMWIGKISARGVVMELLDRRLYAVNHIQATLGMNHASFFALYLCFPTYDCTLKMANFYFIVEKVQQKLQGWKANLLSFARRKAIL